MQFSARQRSSGSMPVNESWTAATPKSWVLVCEIAGAGHSRLCDWQTEDRNWAEAAVRTLNLVGKMKSQ